MNIRERLEGQVAEKQRKYENAIRCQMRAIEDLQEVLDIDIPFYANVYVYGNGVNVYVNDQATTGRLAKDPHDETLREAVAAFNGFVSAVMEAAGISRLDKQMGTEDLTATVCIEGHRRNDKPVYHYFYFRWLKACEGRRFRVTKVEEIVICGEPDASQYDSIEEIANE